MPGPVAHLSGDLVPTDDRVGYGVVDFREGRPHPRDELPDCFPSGDRLGKHGVLVDHALGIRGGDGVDVTRVPRVVPTD